MDNKNETCKDCIHYCVCPYHITLHENKDCVHFSRQIEGEWIEHDDDWCGAYYTCSVCGCDWTTIDGTPQENNMRYCPECGAKMKGGAE